MWKSHINSKERNSLHLICFLWVGPWVVYRMVLSASAENIQWFSAKAVWTNFFIGANSHENVLSAFAFEFQMVVKLQGFTLCEWNKTGRCQQNGLAAFHLFFFFSFSRPMQLETWHTVWHSRVLESANLVRNSESYKEKTISYQKGIADV